MQVIYHESNKWFANTEVDAYKEIDPLMEIDAHTNGVEWWKKLFGNPIPQFRQYAFDVGIVKKYNTKGTVGRKVII
jgi:hypothetical protein